MKRDVNYPKEWREAAKAQGKGLVHYGYELKDKSYCDHVGPCDEEAAQVIVVIARGLHFGKTIDEAAQAAKDALAAYRERQAARAAGGTQ